MQQSVSSWITQLKENALDTRLADLYGTQAVTAQRQRYCALLSAFSARFGAERRVILVSVPGRTEIGGNHTDHQGGQVLAGAVSADCIAVVSQNHTDSIRLEDTTYGQMELSLASLSPIPGERNTSLALLRGMAAELARQGVPVTGFDGMLDSQVPVGAGLSSSAVFSVLMGSCFLGLSSGKIADPLSIAQVAQRAEADYFGKPCGLMDQLACALGGFVTIDFSDGKNPLIRKLNADFSDLDLALFLINTGGSHANLTGAYAAIPQEMRLVAARFGKTLLSQVAPADFYGALPSLRKSVPDRAILRALHYFKETERAAAQAAALDARDKETFLALVNASGRSSFSLLQNVCSPDGQEQGLALALALSEDFLDHHVPKNTWAVRVHGGGFAGTIQAFVPKNLATAYAAYMESMFGPGSCHRVSIRKAGAILL